MFRTLTGAIFAAATLVLSASPALAQAAAPGQPSAFAQLIPFFVVLGIMYFLMIRPQMNKQKAHQQFVSQMKRGDEVVTSSGILGRIEGLTDLYVTLEISPGVRIKVLRSQIASGAPTGNTTEVVKA